MKYFEGKLRKKRLFLVATLTELFLVFGFDHARAANSSFDVAPVCREADQLSYPLTPRTPLEINATITTKEQPTSWVSYFWPITPGTAAFLTLFATLIISHFRNRHEKELQKIETDSRLRQSIYIEGVEAIARVVNAYGKLFSAKPDEYFKQVEDSGYTAAAYKINLIGTNRTLEAMHNFGMRFGELSLELASTAAIVQMLDLKAKNISERIDETLASQSSILSQWKAAPESERSKENYEKFLAEFNEKKKEFYDMDEERSETWRITAEKRLELTSDGLSKLKSISDSLTEVCFAVREEIKFPVGHDRFHERAQEAFESTQRSVLKFQNELEKANEQFGLS